jgi:hypothetical protein
MTKFVSDQWHCSRRDERTHRGVVEVSETLLREDEEKTFQHLHEQALQTGIYLDVSRDRQSPDDWFIRGLYAMSKNKVYSHGSGAQILKSLFDIADTHKKIIRLEPWASGKRKSGEDWFGMQQRLVKYYKALGFVADPGRNGLLIRYPK